MVNGFEESSAVTSKVMTSGILVILILMHQFSVCTPADQSSRTTLLDDEDVHDMYKEEKMEDITNSLVSQLSSACDVTHVIVRLILKEAEERTKLALRMNARIRKMGSKLGNINVEPPAAEPVIAFTARLGSHAENLRPLQVIVFKEVLTSVGEGFRPAAGQFRAPIKGLYQFFVSIFSGYNDRIETELVVNTKSKIQLYSGGSKHGAASNSAILVLEEADIVWVRVFRNRGRFIHSWSTFSGYLLRTIK